MTVQNILKVYPHLAKNFLFKSCERNWIVVLEKLPDTKTNESRHVFDERYAKYRANKLKVVLIFNKHSPKETKSEIYNSVFEKKKLLYKSGEIVEADSFDTFFDNVVTNGIHYFKTLEPAFHQESKSGYLQWYDNGERW